MNELVPDENGPTRRPSVIVILAACAFVLAIVALLLPLAQQAYWYVFSYLARSLH